MEVYADVCFLSSIYIMNFKKLFVTKNKRKMQKESIEDN